jgi:tetratricopeptide (TPR) repeat protein
MRNTILLFVVWFALMAAGEAQQRGEQNPPPPPTTPTQPTPQPRAPTPVPDRQPIDRSINISGRLVANARLPERQIEVRLEGQSAERVGYAYTDGAGEFTFRGVSVAPDQIYYLIANVEGFKPVRERLDYGRDLLFSPRLTIFLESEVVFSTDGNGPSVVGVRQLKTKIPDKALDEYKKALKDSTAGNHKQAVERLERAIKLAPDFYEAQNNLGAQYLRAQRFREAEKAFAHARDLNPEAAEPLLNLGTLEYQQGEIQAAAGKEEEAGAAFEKALTLLDESIRRNPLLAPAHQYLGATFYKTANFEKAESSLRRALELDSKLSDAELMLVNVYTRQNRFEEALKQIDSYMEKFPKASQRPALEKIREQIQGVLKR